MKTTTLPHLEKSLEHNSLFLASLIFRDVNRTVTGIQMIVAVLLQYALIGASITDNLIDLAIPTASEKF